jgi:hypothetical protein
MFLPSMHRVAVVTNPQGCESDSQNQNRRELTAWAVILELFAGYPFALATSKIAMQ